MFGNVLVGVDGRQGGRDAIALALRLGDPDRTLTLAHFYSGALRPSHAISPALVREEREASEKLLEDERATAGVDGTLISATGSSPGRGLHELAEERDADLLVVGSCSHGAFGRVMLGDDTREALNGAPCAVAIAPSGYARHRTPPGKIGVGYNDSPESKAALATARELAAATGAAIHALEVVSLPSYAYGGIGMPIYGAGIEEMLNEATSRMNTLHDVVGHAVYGLTGEELAAFSNDVDILIVGSRGYGPVKRLVLGSTANYLERHARCALLVLPRLAASHAAGEGQRAGVTVTA